MTPDRWPRTKRVLEKAWDLDAAARAVFLDEACAGDPELRAEVEALLASDENATQFLARPAMDLDVLARVIEDEEPDLIGTRIGRYTIQALIGKGGMGAVYRAIREDDFRMQVAIKLLKRGTDTDTALRRFRSERQMLAGLQHPNIARLLDGGATETGLPYFVMECVDGTPLLEYAAGLPVRRRLELFRAVCQAVHYAHQNLIVHRDIKPANILVTREGIPKLLDFGIAKLVDPASAGNATELTAAGANLMTPGYASPEQARGEAVTIASDIYSLGAVLYELLTGQRVQPSKPSTLAKDLDPDLDNIILMALRHEPARRYPSVEEFSDDLDRFLQNLPVHARPESRLYRGRKFLQRNRVPMIAAAMSAVVVAVLIAGVGRFAGVDAGPRSIAVLPLANLSGDKEQEYFAEGVTDELINQLAQIQSLRVISRTSSMSFKGARRTLPEIARSLKVDAIAEGAVLRAGDRVRVDLRIVDAQDRPIWSGRFERELRDVLALQSQIAAAIAGKIHVALSPANRAKFSRDQPVNPDAYDAYLKGRHALFRGTVEDIRNGLRHFDKVLEISPRYAPAYAGLADGYVGLSGMYLRPREAMAKAKAAAARALELDADLAEAHVSMGLVHGWYEFDWDKAEEEFKRAVDLRPNDASARLWYGQYMFCVGRGEESIRQLSLAHELDPLSAYIETGLGQAYYLLGEDEEAIRRLRNVVASDPNFWGGRMWLGVAYLYGKQYGEAVRELEQARQLDPSQPQSLAYLAHAHAKLGDRQTGARYLRQLSELRKDRFVGFYLSAIASLGVGTGDPVEWLQKAYEERDDMLSWLKVDRLMDPLRADPRFKLLMRQVGFGERQ